MNALQALAQRFRFNEKVLARSIEGFAASDWLRRAAPDSSHSLWILGHVALYRRTLARGLGVELAVAAWEAGFAKGTRPDDAADPALATSLLEDFTESGQRLEARLGAMTAAEAASPYGRTFPDGSSTLEGVAQFLCWHETYHLGQVGLCRRVCGK